MAEGHGRLCPENPHSCQERPPQLKVGLQLDEAAVLGPLDQLEKQSGLLRAYCTPILIWQSLPQIFAIYGTGATAFLATASARVFSESTITTSPSM
ncbi:TraM recognition domain-containing protein [Rhizobium sp. L43]|uniref:TraM recognition domain-containing protein n=1 Tax=Rhizobium sp. L43 TaxID=2035452 RepID=UPI000BE987E8|nr:TraM recognition domain-containing protein [Rhizobium sp. L43]PDS77118.1 hypothetical protein CO667_18150 [Rhizobium sp. L43]